MKQPKCRGGIAVLLITSIGAAPAVFAQSDYPTRPVRIVVAYSPGAGVDLMARVVAQKLGDAMGQQFVVENRPGANGLVGAQSVSKSPADGYTMLVIDRGALTINPVLMKAHPYDPVRDLAYTGVITELRYVLTVGAKLPAADFREFVALARAAPEKYNYASFGLGSILHLNFEQLNTHFGMKLVHVPYKGSNAAAAAVVSGEAATVMSSWTAVAGLVREGRLRALVYGSTKRSPQLPDVPTIGEVGGSMETMTPGYFTFALPAGTPEAIMTRLVKELGRAVQLPDVTEKLVNAGLDPLVMTPAAFVESVRNDLARFGKMAKGLAVDPQ